MYRNSKFLWAYFNDNLKNPNISMLYGPWMTVPSLSLEPPSLLSSPISVWDGGRLPNGDRYPLCVPVPGEPAALSSHQAPITESTQTSRLPCGDVLPSPGQAPSGAAMCPLDGGQSTEPWLPNASRWLSPPPGSGRLGWSHFPGEVKPHKTKPVCAVSLHGD